MPPLSKNLVQVGRTSSSRKRNGVNNSHHPTYLTSASASGELIRTKPSTSLFKSKRTTPFTRTVRLCLGICGAVLSCFVLIKEQAETSWVSNYIQTSLVMTIHNDRQLLNGSVHNNDNDGRAELNRGVAPPFVSGGSSNKAKNNKPTTWHMLLGDPDMMNRTIQAIALSPHHPGRLVAYVNTMQLNCTQRLDYIENAGAVVGIRIGRDLIHGHPTQGVWVRDIHTTVELNIPLEAYEQLRERGNGVQVTVRDLVAGTDHTIPLLVDPSPSTFLSGLVWINKSRRFYDGRQEDIHKKKKRNKDFWKNSRRREEVGIRLGPAPRNDAYTLSHLLPWIQYHREQGVQHIYILDQENNLTQPNFPLTPPFLTYIRAPYAFMDYFVDVCDPVTNQVKSRGRMAVLQHILDSLVLRMTTSEWMIQSDLDEFMVPAAGEGNLPALIQDFAHQHCQGLPWQPHYRNPMWEQWQNITCTPTRRPIFELQFYQVKLHPDNTITLSDDKVDYWALTKTIYHTPYTARSRVHFGYPLHDSALSTKVLPHKGFFAHYRSGAPSSDLLKRMPLHAEKLKQFSLEGQKELLARDDDNFVQDVGTALMDAMRNKQQQQASENEPNMDRIKRHVIKRNQGIRATTNNYIHTKTVPMIPPKSSSTTRSGTTSVTALTNLANTALAGPTTTTLTSSSGKTTATFYSPPSVIGTNIAGMTGMKSLDNLRREYRATKEQRNNNNNEEEEETEEQRQQDEEEGEDTATTLTSSSGKTTTADLYSPPSVIGTNMAGMRTDYQSEKQRQEDEEEERREKEADQVDEDESDQEDEPDEEDEPDREQ